MNEIRYHCVHHSNYSKWDTPRTRTHTHTERERERERQIDRYITSFQPPRLIRWCTCSSKPFAGSHVYVKSILTYSCRCESQSRERERERAPVPETWQNHQGFETKGLGTTGGSLPLVWELTLQVTAMPIPKQFRKPPQSVETDISQYQCISS
jgi:hypothetical protein